MFQRKTHSIVRTMQVRLSGAQRLPLPLVLCLFILILASCTNPFDNNNAPGGSGTKASLSKQTYTIPQVGILDFDTLDPALAHDPASIQAIQMLYTGLVQQDDELHIRSQLAQSWHLDADGVTWTFTLKPHLKFSDGTPLTSVDVAYSLDRALQPATKSTVAPDYLKLLKDSDQLMAGNITTLIGDSIFTPNPQTVILVTNKPTAYFLAMLSNPCAYVVEKRLLQRYGASFTDHLDAGGGAGPFKVADYVHRSHIDFVPNQNYYAAHPQLQKVTMVFYHSADASYHDYQNNRLDESEVPMTDLAAAQKRKDFHEVPQLWINYYTMNYLTKPFDNIHIRQAFALAINKTALASTVWKNTIQATNHIVPPGISSYNPNLTGPTGTTSLSGDPQRARQLLQQGLQEEHWQSVNNIPAIQLTYVSGVSNFDQEVQSLIQTWKQVLNVQVTANPVDYNTLLNDVNQATNNTRGIQMWSLSWIGEYPDPQDWLSLQFEKNSPYNNMNYGENTSATAAQQQVLQQQLEKADADENKNERVSIYQQAEQQLVKDVAWIPTGQMTETFLRNSTIVGITDNAENIIPPNDWAHIYRIQ